VVVTDDHLVEGIITDGDLRRMLEKEKRLEGLQAMDIMSKNPITISEEMLAVDALEIMKVKDINHLIVADNRLYKGIVHIHDIIKEGII